MKRRRLVLAKDNPNGHFALLSGALRPSSLVSALARTLYRMEAYNGFGSRRKGINTPYLWAFSNHYTKGKYVADGKWNPDYVSTQCGGAVMLKALITGGKAALPS